MITARESIEKFDEKTAELINSKFLLAEKKIEEVLVTIADSVLLYEIFEHVSEGFDYKTFKSVCFSHLKDGRGYFRLPKNDADVIAFCFALLLEIDGGKVDLLELCNDFFPTDDGKQKSFNLFASQLLIPFKKATLTTAYAVLDAQGDNGAKAKKQGASKVNPSVKTQTQAEKFIVELQGEIDSLSRKNVDLGVDVDELTFVLEEMLEYLKTNNLRGVTLAFTALKYLSVNVKGVKIDLSTLAKLIAEEVE